MSDKPMQNSVKGSDFAEYLSIYELKSCESKDRLLVCLESNQVVPLARTRKTGEKIETLSFAVPEGRLSKIRVVSSSCDFGKFRRDPREIIAAAKVLQAAIPIKGKGVEFYLVPNDEKPIFYDNCDPSILRRQELESFDRIASALEEIVMSLKTRDWLKSCNMVKGEG